MQAYIVRRLLWAVPQILIVLILVFVATRLLPGNPVRAVVGGAGVTGEFIEAFEAKYRLNDSIPAQFWAYIVALFHGDLGVSLTSRQPVSTIIGEVLPKSLVLASAALLVGWPLGIIFGGMAAKRQGRSVDLFLSSGATLLISIPAYVLGLFLLYLMSFRNHWLPTAGDQGIRSFILPWLTLTLLVTGLSTRVARSSVVDAAWAEHVRVARAKGLRERKVWRRHVVRNALIPLTTLAGITFAELLGGAIFVETIFLRPGLGRTAVEAITRRDYPMVQGIILVVAITYMLVNLVVDVLYAMLDPKFRDSLHASRTQ